MDKIQQDKLQRAMTEPPAARGGTHVEHGIQFGEPRTGEGNKYEPGFYHEDVVKTLRDKIKHVELQMSNRISATYSSYVMWKSEYKRHLDFASWRNYQRALLVYFQTLSMAKDLDLLTQDQIELREDLLQEWGKIDDAVPVQPIDKQV